MKAEIEALIKSKNYKTLIVSENNEYEKARPAPYDRIEWTDIFWVHSIGASDAKDCIIRSEEEAKDVCKSLRPYYYSVARQIRILSDGTWDVACCYYTSNVIKEKEVA